MLCCCDRRTAHVAVVLLSLIIFFFHFLRGIEVFIAADWGLRGPYAAPIALLAMGTIGLCVAALDGYGIMKEKASFMMPFLVYMIVHTIIVGMAALVYILVMDSKFSDYRTNSSSFIVGCFLAVGLNVYFCTVVSSHIREVKTKRGPARRKGEEKKIHKDGSEEVDNDV